MTKTQPQGTPVEGAYDSYTAEQLAALEEIKDRKYALGVAKSAYINQVLNADGSFSKDVAALEKAAKAEITKLSSGDLTDPDHLRKMEQSARRYQEITSHIAQQRFLFVVNGDKIVYFQCATNKAKMPHHVRGKDGTFTATIKTVENPDLPPLATDGDRDAIEESKATIQRTIAESHERAAARRNAANVGVIQP